MCARFTLAVPDFAWLARALEVAVDAGSTLGAADQPPAGASTTEAARLYRPRYNVAPSDVHLVLRAQDGRRELVPALWGITPRWSQGPAAAPARRGAHAGGSAIVNARAETARSKPTFRGAFAARRCVVPADGFYEWTGAKGARRPFWFHPAEGGLLHLAGLYEAAADAPTGQPHVTFTILTTGPNAEVAKVHDRMPAILTPADVTAWLSGATPEQAEALLRPAPPGALIARPVSTRVNSVSNDDPSLLREERPEASGTLPLFGPRG